MIKAAKAQQMEGSETPGWSATHNAHTAMVIQPQICQVGLLERIFDQTGVLHMPITDIEPILPYNRGI